MTDTSTAVTTQKRRTLDLDSAKTEARFIEAFGKGELNRLTQEEQTMFLMAFGQKIGVRAELGEVMIYQGKPYITLAGRVRIAHKTGLLNGIQPRPATTMEARHFGASEDEVVWTCEVWRIGITRPFKGWGVANRKMDRNPVAKQYPREMAKKRAKYDALALAFPPDEVLGEIHMRFIDAAEELALREAARHGGQGMQLIGEGAERDTVPEEAETAEVTDADLTQDDSEAPTPPPAGLEEDEDEDADLQLDAEIEAADSRSGELPLGGRDQRRHRVAQREGR